MYNALFVEAAQVVPAFGPKDINGAAQAGDWVNLKNHRKCCVVLQKGTWAGGTPAVTVVQATSAAGAGSKAVSFTRRWRGTALTQDTLAEAAVTGDTFNLSATANEFDIVEIDAGDLDHNNGFTYLGVAVASPGAFADLLSACYILYQSANIQRPANRPTVIANILEAQGAVTEGPPPGPPAELTAAGHTPEPRAGHGKSGRESR